MVLILIIMEDTHGGVASFEDGGYSTGLNPYCNGRYSWSTSNFFQSIKYSLVLILIVMEDTHGDLAKRLRNRCSPLRVLILIVMEDTHGDTGTFSNETAGKRS